MHSLGFNLQASPVQSKPKILKPRHSSASNRPYETEPGPSSSAGKIKRLVLSNEGRTKLNLDPDRDFYSYPRFVNHVDDRFISALTDLYRERIRPGSVVLDLMSSWVSHLPEEVKYEKVVGHGLNAQELARNPRLDYFFVKDLNEDQRFEFDDQTFDSVLCSVGVQYLQEPEKVFAEANRVMKAGGVFIVSFSNRMFYEKAVREWREGSGYSRVQLVVQYFQCVEGFTQPEVVRGGDQTSVLDRLLGFLGLSSGPDPFYALVAYKSFKPLYH
ncbi:PREDICTED: uncharacterized protein LOC104821099 [Tarenaya hassleriana]|uniref:uncharacterized protein LOC104821099 n=1 Tax=Tarenaya hassleriana TaxID=28532 RepID=UPI00053C1E97|nr:PREDICTED: uncharacterized protein LOC104821099 [Tarenaya hassleriana]